MNREEKTELLNMLHEVFSNAESVVITEYLGLTVAEADELRNKNLNRSNEETSKVKPLDDITKERVNATSKQEE